MAVEDGPQAVRKFRAENAQWLAKHTGESTPESRRRHQFEEDQKWFGAQARELDRVWNIRKSMDHLDSSGKLALRSGQERIPMYPYGAKVDERGRREMLTREDYKRRTGVDPADAGAMQARETGLMVGAAELVTTPFGAGQVAKWAGRGVKTLFEALARRQALKKTPGNWVRGIRNVGDSRPHDAPVTVYRGVEGTSRKVKKAKIKPGDWVTEDLRKAKVYAGQGNPRNIRPGRVIEKEVSAGDLYRIPIIAKRGKSKFMYSPEGTPTPKMGGVGESTRQQRIAKQYTKSLLQRLGFGGGGK